MNYLHSIISKYKNPLALTGAGISIPCGIKDTNSTVLGVPIKKILSIDFYEEDPKRFFRYFREILYWIDLQPSKTHYALAELGIKIITENIDGLHEKAGSKNVLDIHGSLKLLKCPKCSYSISSHDALLKINILEISIKCPYCNIFLKPSVILLGEPVIKFNEAVNIVYQSDLLLLIGTNLDVWPANQLVYKAKREGCKLLKVNEQVLEPLF